MWLWWFIGIVQKLLLVWGVSLDEDPVDQGPASAASPACMWLESLCSRIEDMMFSTQQRYVPDDGHGGAEKVWKQGIKESVAATLKALDLTRVVNLPQLATSPFACSGKNSLTEVSSGVRKNITCSWLLSKRHYLKLLRHLAVQDIFITPYDVTTFEEMYVQEQMKQLHITPCTR